MAKFVLLAALAIAAVAVYIFKFSNSTNLVAETAKNTIEETITPLDPLAIEHLRTLSYPGSEIKTVQILPPGGNYQRHIASFESEGHTVYGLLTIPNEEAPNGGFPAIVFDHGYIAPEEYATTERYIAYVDNLASAGYVVFKIDFRGHGESEGTPGGAYFSPTYTTDTLNASSSLKKLPYINANKIGVWGHSMSGMVATRAMAIAPDEFKAVVIWGGVVGSYEDVMREWWSKRNRVSPTFSPSQREMNANRPSRQAFIEKHGEPSEKSDFWQSISPKTFIKDYKAPIQLHHGQLDETVPYQLSELFAKALEDNKKEVELYIYPGADHDISSPSYETAMARTIEFFDKYLK